MCLESSTPRTLIGGAIATLQPRQDISSSALDRLTAYKLHLRNDTNSSSQPRTIATLISPTFLKQRPSLENYRVVIQRDGDLTATTSSPLSPPMHTFQFAADHGNTSPTLKLDTAMDLSVGGEGLIGRRVQLVEIIGDRESQAGRVLSEGVLGWN